MKSYLLDVGEGNSMAANQILVILNPNTAPSKRLRAQAKQVGRLVDATGGKLTKSLVVTASNHLILSNQEPEELAKRLNELLGLVEKNEP
jgi:regulator of extracellular matrix RemA (YlzA/DUF370 family)